MGRCSLFWMNLFWPGNNLGTLGCNTSVSQWNARVVVRSPGLCPGSQVDLLHIWMYCTGGPSGRKPGAISQLQGRERRTFELYHIPISLYKWSLVFGLTDRGCPPLLSGLMKYSPQAMTFLSSRIQQCVWPGVTWVQALRCCWCRCSKVSPTWEGS